MRLHFHRSSFNLAFALVVSAAAAACGSSSNSVSDEVAASEEAADSTEVTSDEASTITIVTDGAELAGAQSGVDLARFEAANIGARLVPAGCFSATTNGATVTYSFNDCSGPRGMVHLNGTVTVTYAMTNGTVSVQVNATDFAINQSTVTIDSSATYANDNGTKTLMVDTAGSGTGPLGRTITRAGTYTLTWTATCFTLNGQWSTTTPSATRSTTVDDFTRCAGTCPAAGGSIAHTYINGVTLTITFDGSATAKWSASNGKSGSFSLICLPNP